MSHNPSHPPILAQPGPQRTERVSKMLAKRLQNAGPRGLPLSGLDEMA